LLALRNATAAEVASQQHSRRLNNHNHHNVTGYEPVSALDLAREQSQYTGNVQLDPVFVYVSSDNDRIKEAFIHYLQDDTALTEKVQFIRVKSVEETQVVQHAKNMEYLTAGNASGSFNLFLDWYALSLANTIFAWRRDTHFISTYVQSAIRLSGNSQQYHLSPSDKEEKVKEQQDEDHKEQSEADEDEGDWKMKEHARGYQLIFRGNTAKWKEF